MFQSSKTLNELFLNYKRKRKFFAEHLKDDDPDTVNNLLSMMVKNILPGANSNHKSMYSPTKSPVKKRFPSPRASAPNGSNEGLELISKLIAMLGKKTVSQPNI